MISRKLMTPSEVPVDEESAIPFKSLSVSGDPRRAEYSIPFSMYISKNKTISTSTVQD